MLVDSCVLLEVTARRSLALECLRVISGQVRLLVANQTLREYLSVCTRPTGQNGLGMSMQRAKANVETWLQAMSVASDHGVKTYNELSGLLTVPCSGKQVHDAGLAAIAYIHSVPVLTLNVDDFHRFAHRIHVVHPRHVQ